MRKLIKVLRENIIIVIPSIVVFMFIVGFFIFGMLDPSTTEVEYSNNLIEEQYLLEQQLVDDYHSRTFTESNPFFVLNPYGISPLSGLMMFDTSTEKSFIVVIQGKDEYADIEFVTDTETTHYIPIYGLYEDHLNEIVLYENVDGVKGEVVSTKFIQTEELPSDLNRTVLINTSYEYFQDDIMLLIPYEEGYPVAYDYNGDVRWLLTEQLSFTPVPLENGRLLVGSSRMYSDNADFTSLYEIDYLGKVYKEYIVPGGYHSDALVLPNGNILALTNDYEGTLRDVIVEINNTNGNIVNTWDLKDVIDQTEAPSTFYTETNWFNASSIDYNEDTKELLVTGTNQDVIVSLNYDTKEINYIIGDKTSWTKDMQDNYFLTPTHPELEWQYSQNDAMFTPEGIFVFDNGVNKAKYEEDYINPIETYSRGVFYNVHELTSEITQIYEFGKDRGPSFYSPYIGNVQYLDRDNYLIHSGGQSYIGAVFLNVPYFMYEGSEQVHLKSTTIEILNNEVVYELVLAGNYESALHTSFYSENTKFSIGKGKHIGAFKETVKDEETPDLNINFFETVPTKYEMTYIKEIDRLVITGLFNEEDEVYVVLRNNTTNISYHIPTTYSPDNQTIINETDEDLLHITFFINEANVGGYYEIYIVVNDTLYNAYKHVYFD